MYNVQVFVVTGVFLARRFTSLGKGKRVAFRNRALSTFNGQRSGSATPHCLSDLHHRHNHHRSILSTIQYQPCAPHITSLIPEIPLGRTPPIALQHPLTRRCSRPPGDFHTQSTLTAHFRPPARSALLHEAHAYPISFQYRHAGKPFTNSFLASLPVPPFTRC